MRDPGSHHQRQGPGAIPIIGAECRPVRVRPLRSPAGMPARCSSSSPLTRSTLTRSGRLRRSWMPCPGLPEVPSGHRYRYRTALRSTPQGRHPPVLCPAGKDHDPRGGGPADPLGFVVRETVKHDRGVEPLFCFAREHFVRSHLRRSPGEHRRPTWNDRKDRVCHAVPVLRLPGRAARHGATQRYHLPALQQTAPPLSGRSISGNSSMMRSSGRCRNRPADMTLGTKKELLKILTICREELPTSSFYDYHMLAQKLATSPLGY